MYRTWVIARHTFHESVVQPIYTVVLALGTAILVIYALLPFFTLGEDTIMYKSVALDAILILVLIATLFATSRSIFDEIEDRTMLTLMSKPLKRREVLIGKYLGIIIAAGLMIAFLGAILCACTWWRIPDDSMISTAALDERVRRELWDLRRMHIIGLGFALAAMWVEISALAAVGVALSTRFSLVVNFPVVILIYIAGNLTRFLHGPTSPMASQSTFIHAITYVGTLPLPLLEAFDFKALAVVSPLRIGKHFANDPNAVSVARIWRYLIVSTGYGLCYIVLALSAGLWLFESRELGGAEG